MHTKGNKVQVATDEARRLLLAARTMPTSHGNAACIPHPALYDRITGTQRSDASDRKEASQICATCPLLEVCPVAVTDPG